MESTLGGNPPEPVRTSDNDGDNLVETVEVQLTGPSARKGERSGAQGKRDRKARLANSSLVTSQLAVNVVTSPGPISQPHPIDKRKKNRPKKEISKENDALPRKGYAHRFNNIFIRPEAVVVKAINIWSED